MRSRKLLTLATKGYLPHRRPRAAYAAMITRMDRDIGRILDLLEELGLDDNTLVIFTSDNGPTSVGGVDHAFFQSSGRLRGHKAEVYEGGIRVPMIARWPGRIKAGSVSDHVSAFWDVLPTLAELAGVDVPDDIDGISFLPTLLGEGEQEEHVYLYWEYARRHQAVRLGDWKGLRKKPSDPIEIYDLANDPAEAHDLAEERPELVAKIARLMTTARTESEHFPLKLD